MEGSIHHFAESGDQAGVVKCISSGVDVNGPDTSNRSPLHYAAIGGHTEIVALLLSSGASVNCQTNRGATPLHYSARSGKVECMSLLLENGADVNCRDSSGNTPLHDAIKCHEIKAALALIQNYGADVNIQNKEDQSPIFLACQYGYKDVIIELIEKGAKINIRDKVGNTPLTIIHCLETEQKDEVNSKSLQNDIGSLMYVVKNDQKLNGTSSSSSSNEMDRSEDGSKSSSNSISHDDDNVLYSDVTFSVEGHKIPAHRAILAARCPHFKSLFKKSSSEVIDITDVKISLFTLLLEWIYKDTITDIIKPDQIDLSSAYSLLVLAERYQIKQLMAVCESYLITNLTTTTFGSVWPEIKKSSTQLKQSCSNLMRSCAQFFAKNWNVLCVSKIADDMSKNDIVSMLTILPMKVYDPNEPQQPPAASTSGATSTSSKSKSSSSSSSNTPAANTSTTSTATTRHRASTGGASTSKTSATPKKQSTTSAGGPPSSSHTATESPPTSDIMDKKNTELCLSIYHQIYKRKMADVFHYPVDPVADGVPTYFDIIKNPMDLSTIKKKLDNGSYKTIKEYAADMRLMFVNALTFNLDGTPIWKLAKSLLQFFNTRFVAIFPFETIPEMPAMLPPPPPPAATSSAAVNNNLPPQTPEKKRKSTTTPSTTATVSTESKPSNVETTTIAKKKYTDDERRILMDKINELNEEHLQTVIDIIEPNAIKQNDDGAEIDMYEVSDANLEQLEAFINTCLKKRKTD